MARQFFKDLPDTTTPITAPRMNALLDGDEALGNLVVDSIKTTNLLNPNTLINGTVSASDGSYSNVNYVVVSDYIPVEANKPYTIKLNNITNSQFLFRIVLYTTSKVYSSTLHTGSEVTQKTITPAIDGYVRICFGVNGYEVLSPTTIAQANPQFEQSSSATAYKPFIEFGINNFKNEEIVVGSIRTKNMFGNWAILPGWIDGTTMNIHSDGNNRLACIPCKPNTTYTISRQVATTIFRVASYNQSLPIPTSTATNYTIQSAIQNNDGYKITYTTNETAKWLVIHYGHIVNDSNIAQSFATIQVEEGIEATNYMPYQNLNYQEYLLWKNTNTNSGFSPQNITLSTGDYDYYEVIFLEQAGFTRCSSTGRIPKGYSCTLLTNRFYNNEAPQIWRRSVTYSDDTTLSIEKGQTQLTNTTSSNDNNGVVVPFKVIGYK